MQLPCHDQIAFQHQCNTWALEEEIPVELNMWLVEALGTKFSMKEGCSSTCMGNVLLLAGRTHVSTSHLSAHA